MSLTSSKFGLSPSDTRILRTEAQHACAGCRATMPVLFSLRACLALGGGRREGAILQATSKLSVRGRVGSRPHYGGGKGKGSGRERRWRNEEGDRMEACGHVRRRLAVEHGTRNARG